MNTLKLALSLLTPRERRWFAALMVMAVMQSVLELASIGAIAPFMMVAADPSKIHSVAALAWLYGTFGFDSNTAFLILMAVVALAALIVANAFALLNAWAQARFIEGRTLSLAQRLLSHYLHQPYEFFLGRNSSELSKAVLSEARQVVTEAIAPMIRLIANILAALAIVAFLVALDPRIAAAAAIVLGGCYSLFFVMVRSRLKQLGAEQLVANKRRFKQIQEAFGGIKDVKVLNQERSMLELFRSPAAEMARIGVRAAIIKQIPKMILTVVLYSGILGTTVFMLIAHDGDLSVVLPLLAVFALAAFRLIPKLQGIFQTLATLRYSQAVVENVKQEFLRYALPERLPQRQTPLPALRHSLELRDIEYCYPRAETPALRGISLRIPVNATVGLMGATGGGKTTLGDVIMGLLSPQKGQLLIDGEPLGAGNLPAWMAQIGYVPQHIFLADDSLARNIAFGVPPGKIDMAAVEWAARVANIHDFIAQELPQGYDTVAGDRGIRLSGGQRQRIGIARALYRNPGLLLLDEATSALDGSTESAVMSAIAKLSGSRTIILIAHRLTTLSACSMIHEISAGRIARSGSYAELIGGRPNENQTAQGGIRPATNS